MKNRRNSNNSWLIILVLVIVATSFLFLSCLLISTVERARDVEEINSLLASLSVSEEEQLREMKRYKLDGKPRRVLLVGMIASLQELYDNTSVVSSLAKVCWVYQHDKGRLKEDQDQGEGFLSVHILYAKGQNSREDTTTESTLKENLEQSGCRARLVPQEDLLRQQSPQLALEFEGLNRYSKLSKLRSLHRRHILDSIRQASNGELYDAVINIDLDLIQLPPLHAVTQAVERAATGYQTNSNTGSIVCANGYETWSILGMIRPLFYDTMAAVDTYGSWLMTEYSTNVLQVLTFGQTVLLRDILRQGTRLWLMQSCFGGVAVYDFETWSTPDCDYDRDNIKLQMPIPSSTAKETKGRVRSNSNKNDSSSEQAWTIAPKFTLGFTGQDACEHVVFQQCLQAAAHSVQGGREIKVGIQPNLIIKREAAILARWEDIWRLVEIILKALLVLATFAGIFVPAMKMYQYSSSSRTVQKRLHIQ